MSHENPGDGIRCDHCNCAAAETRDKRLGFLAPNRGEQLCSLCIWIAVDTELVDSGRYRREGAKLVPVYATSRSDRYRKATMREIAIEREMRRG